MGLAYGRNYPENQNRINLFTLNIKWVLVFHFIINKFNFSIGLKRFYKPYGLYAYNIFTYLSISHRIYRIMLSFSGFLMVIQWESCSGNQHHSKRFFE